MGQEPRPSRPSLALLAMARPVRSHATEPEFQDWYRRMAEAHQLSPDPEGQFYDYRAAMAAGASPDETGHWPSTFKQPGHPNEVVGGFSTITGERVPGAPLARSAEELIRLGWQPEVATRLWQSVQSPRNHNR